MINSYNRAGTGKLGGLTEANALKVTFEKHLRPQEGGEKVETIKGTAAGITKLIAVSRHATFTPKPGQVWLCRKIFDTLPGEPKKGVLFVLPLVEQVRNEKFDIWNGLSKAFEPVTNLSQTIRLGNETLEHKYFELRKETDIDSHWPEWVKSNLRIYLRRAADERARWLEDSRRESERFDIRSLCQVEADQRLFEVRLIRKTGFVEQQPVVFQVGSAADIKPEWPDSVKGEITQLIESYDAQRQHFIDFHTKERIEWSTNWRGEEPEVYPGVTRTVLVGYEKKGETCTIVKCLEDVGGEWPDRVQAIAIRMLAEADQRNGLARERLARKALIAGLERDKDGNIRFQWAGEFLTDGQHWLPRVRPKGEQWRALPVSAVPEGYWESFLNGLEGKLVAELLPYHREGSWRAPVRKRVSLTERQKQIAATIKAEIKQAVQGQGMWRGDGVDAVAIGKCVVFFVPRPGKSDLYVVDNPGPGAIYCFTDKDEAYELAQDKVARLALIKRGARRILHIPGWQTRLAAAINAA